MKERVGNGGNVDFSVGQDGITQALFFRTEMEGGGRDGLLMGLAGSWLAGWCTIPIDDGCMHG